ncbi:MAG: redoxin domain-containing protein [Planctomycetia bacterium]|nr:redoxin domain-containing protein [Planctomycetia bacterium]
MKSLLRCAIALVLALSMGMHRTAPAVENASSVGKKVDALSLSDFRGKAHKLDDYRDAKLVVLAFVGVECPLCKLYGPRLADMAKEYGPKGVTFLGIDANRQDSLAELSAYARVHGIEFPLLKDLNNAIADSIGAQRTPEVFVLDSNRVVRYQGRIDDQYGFQSGTGYARPKMTRGDLAEALDELLAGKDVSQPKVESAGCLIGRVKPVDEKSKVTYSNQIARLFQDRCVECHRPGQIGPFSMTSYDESVGWADMIAEVIRDSRMPPWHADPQFGQFANNISLSKDEKQLIYDWVAAGAPQGDPKDMPEPRKYASNLLMPMEPDLIIPMADEPFDVPAEGTVEYKYFRVNPGFKEDKWVKVAECIPDNRAVVHHIIVFLKPPEGTPRDVAAFGHLTGYAPGTRPHVLPEGFAKFVPAGSELVFQLHYTPNGSPQKDCSSVAIKFEDAKNVKYRVATIGASNGGFAIPPHDDNYKVESQQQFNRDILLMSLFPHMHLRGKSFHYEAIYPDGSKETLMNMPRYDFNWQNSYIFQDMKTLPKGTTLHCTAHFDNSENNLANPNPNETVRWGDQTWEEMMIGWYDMAVPVEASLAEAVPSRLERRERGRGQERRSGAPANREAAGAAESDGDAE